MDTSSQQSLSEIDESSKVVPKIFVDYSENSTTECTENNSNTSLLRRIMNNAKSILTQKCASLHPSLSSEEPTKETGEYCSNPIDFPSGKVFKETGLKYTSSDYCMVDEDTFTSTFTTSKKPYPTSIKVFKRERECKTVSTSQNTEDDLQLVKPFLSNRTLSKTSKRAFQFPYGSMEKDFNGPFEPSEFFHTDDTITNNLMSEGSLAQSKVSPSPKSCAKFEEAEKMPDCNVPCRDDSYGDSHSSSISVQGMMGECETLSADFKGTKNAFTKSTEQLQPACKKPSSRSISFDEKRWLEIPDMTKNVRESSQPGKNYGSQDDGKLRIDVEISNFRSDSIRKTTELYDHTTLLRDPRSSNKRLASEKLAEKRKSDHRIDNSPLAKRKCQAASDCRDQDNQCAFIGSPILEASNFKMEARGKKCDNGTFGESMTDIISREKNYRSHIQGFRNREKQYDSISNSLYGINKDSGELESTTKALKSENAALKNEIMEMRLDLKHTLEKVQGPMRLKLEAEKSRCHQLQQELQKAFQNMVVSEENYLREMNVLKKHLCMAGTNMEELEQMNKKLKEEMNIMDMLCAKLEDDLIQQKLNEAETIKRLTHKKYIGGDNVEFDVMSKQESNLHDIARKLSKTIKDCVPCPDCAIGIPAELKGAAKLIKELTDMVDSRKEALSYESGESSVSRTDTSCQSPPPMEEISTQCKDLRTIGTVVSMCLMSGSNILPFPANRFVDNPNAFSAECMEPNEGNPPLLFRSSGTHQEISAHISQTLNPSSCFKLAGSSSKRDSWTNSYIADKTPALLEKLSSAFHSISVSNDPMMIDKKSSTCNKQCYCVADDKSLLRVSPKFRSKTEECNNSITISNSSNYSSQFPDEIESFRPEIKDVDVDESDTINGRIENTSGYDSKIDFSSKMRVLKRDSFSEESDIKIPNREKSDIDEEDTSKKRSKLSVRIDPRAIISKEKAQEDISEASEGFLREEVLRTPQDIQIPLLVDTKVELCETAPENIKVTTSVTESGNLLILTEGRSGIIETVLHYLDDGTIEVVTQITELTKTQSSKKFYIPLAFKVGENVDGTGEKCKKSEKSEMDLQQDIASQLISEHSQSLSERFQVPIAPLSKDELSKEQEDIHEQVVICANLKCVDRNEECVMYKDDKSCNTLVVATVSNGTLLSTTQTDVECSTSPVKKSDIICGPSRSSFLQQTERFGIVQQSTSNPDLPQLNSDLPEPVEPKAEDSKPQMNEETICLKEIFHKETSTERKLGNDAETEPMLIYKDESTTMSEEKLLVQTSKNEIRAREDLNEEVKEKSKEEISKIEQIQEKTEDLKENVEESASKIASILTPVSSKPASVKSKLSTVESESRNQVITELIGKSLTTIDDSLTLFEIDPNQPRRVSDKFRSDECWCPTPCSCKKKACSIDLETSLKENETSFVTDFDVAYVNVKHGVNIFPSKNKKKISINDVFKKKSSEGKHPVDCECVDCICMPLVRQLATTKEFFVAEDNKQIYQMTACSSPHSKKAPLMPVQNCSSESIGKGDYYLRCPYLDADNTDENSLDQPIKNKADVSKSKVCCCTDDCVCDQCKIDMMKKQIKKLKNEVNELKQTNQMQDLSYLDEFNCDIYASGEEFRFIQPEDYFCTECDCSLSTKTSDNTIQGDCEGPKWPRMTCKSSKKECKDSFITKKQMESYPSNHQYPNYKCHLWSEPICKCQMCTCSLCMPDLDLHKHKFSNCGDTCNCEESRARNNEKIIFPFISKLGSCHCLKHHLCNNPNTKPVQAPQTNNTKGLELMKIERNIPSNKCETYISRDCSNIYKCGKNCCLSLKLHQGGLTKDRKITTNPADIRVQCKSFSTSNLLSMHSCARCASKLFVPSNLLRAEKSNKINTKVGRSRSPRRVNIGVTLATHSKSTGWVPANSPKVEISENLFEDCSSVDLSVLNLTDKYNQSINSLSSSNGNVLSKDQMQEIQSVLNNIKSVCSEAEEKAKKAPLIKQVSTFGQTMSGLKLALNNLQERCKSKDLLIEAMTGELRNRTSSISFIKALNKFSFGEIPGDCERYNDALNNFEERKSKAAKNERIIRKRKSDRTCRCGKVHKDTDYNVVDLKEFEITDISKVTDDSVIIKWNRPKSDLVTGYDIFIDGVNKSKVLSGGRTTAMIHSIDLSKNILVSIYVVTKCGICEPPTVAVYHA